MRDEQYVLFLYVYFDGILLRSQNRPADLGEGPGEQQVVGQEKRSGDDVGGGPGAGHTVEDAPSPEQARPPN